MRICSIEPGQVDAYFCINGDSVDQMHSSTEGMAGRRENNINFEERSASASDRADVLQPHLFGLAYVVYYFNARWLNWTT